MRRPLGAAPGTRVGTDPRISRRRRAVERSRRRRAWVGIALAGCAGLLVWGAFFSPLFAVRRVTVAGARHVTGAQVASAAGISPADNLLRVSTAEVRRAAQGLPWVASARVERVLPGTLRVRVVERRPAVLLSLGSARWMIDATGHVLAPADRSHRGLPVLEAVQAADIGPGTRLRTPEVRGALRVFRSLPRALARRVVAILAPSRERITLSLRDGTAVRYGAPEQTRAKNSVLRALLTRLDAEHTTPSYIDVRVPSTPAVSRAAAAPPGPSPSPPA